VFNTGLKGVIVIARVAPDNHVRTPPGVSKFASLGIRFVCIDQVTLRKGCKFARGIQMLHSAIIAGHVGAARVWSAV
jgi:hypothetical protein